ncbi:GH3 auxin-responsive promoter [Phlebopus sp. FC_14]|nr:GH3 auxin-responsive promoter [Phlebopus sp. FC_14]
MPEAPILDPLSSLTPELQSELQKHTDSVLLGIIKANANTQYGRTSPALVNFRQAVNVTTTGDDNYPDTFRETVPLSTYDDYRSYCFRFFESPCKASEVTDLLSPGMPQSLAVSSATSSNRYKYFPRGPQPRAVFPTGEVTSWVWYLGNFRVIDVEGENGQCVGKVPVCSGTASFVRNCFELGQEVEASHMSNTPQGQVAPLAAGLISQYRSFLLIHGLFSLANRDIEVFSIAFMSTIADMLRYIEDEYIVLADAIEKGIIPEYEGIGHVQSYLKTALRPNPERAAELRALGVPSKISGWAGRAWPKLKLVAGIASGPFAHAVPKIKSYLGPTCAVVTTVYASSECMIGFKYNSMNLNQYKLTREEIIEFLDVTADENATNLTSAWEVEAGKRYEIVLTTRDGLWRYRINDVVEIVGFAPSDGSPIFQYVERRSGGIRFSHTVTSEECLKEAILSVQDALGQVLEFTVAFDERDLPATFGYFVEIAGELGPSPEAAPQQVINKLLDLNPDYQSLLDNGKLRKPTIRVVKSGTFLEMRRSKTDKGSGTSIGQIKTPVVLSDGAMKEWIEKHVMQEF